MSEANAAPYEIRQEVRDDLQRSRLTVFFRIVLAIPHLIWVSLWGFAVVLTWPIAWVWTFVAARTPDWALRFYSAYVRYNNQVSSYLYLAADPYPPFTADSGYPVNLRIDANAPQNRWITLFRPVLAIPWLIGAGALSYVLAAVGLVSWFYCLINGRMHEGMRNIITFCVAFTSRAYGFLTFLTDRYPPVSESGFPSS